MMDSLFWISSIVVCECVCVCVCVCVYVLIRTRYIRCTYKSVPLVSKDGVACNLSQP